MSYRHLKYVLCSILAIYFVVGFGVRVIVAGKHPENVYPFFSWSLFAWVPAREQNDFVINVRRIDGRSLETPVPLRALPELYQASGYSRGQVHKLTTSYGREILAKGVGSAGALPFLTVPIEYELVEVIYHPVDYLTEGKVIKERVLGDVRHYRP